LSASDAFTVIDDLKNKNELLVILIIIFIEIFDKNILNLLINKIELT